ncbi:serine protease [Streptomyces oryzae]|uniref:Serine protease n=1 Tax=Streptomyces oryzae TaxID=1434886 RepID=A0ABS3XAJ0_9ACTN|nr:serine protease [Streptomyces oryzae]MBO8192401.1 serine protease [Streptomyces oryzae]
MRLRDLAGRPRGLGFVADGLGTVVTSHEAVDGLGRAVLHVGEDAFTAASCDITPLPEWNLALIRTPGLGVDPLVIGRERPHPRSPALLLTEDEAHPTTLTGTVPATYTSTARYHALERVLQLELPEAASIPLRLCRTATGAPLVDAATGAVLGVLGTALHGTTGQPGPFAVPLYAAGVPAPDGPLGVLLRRNGASAPGFGPDLNLAGVLRLAGTSVGPAVDRCAHAVTRPEVAGHFDLFAHSGASVIALVGAPGTGRTTELAAAAARRARAVAPAPSVWLRGAELHPRDAGLREAVGRALAAADRAVAASHAQDGNETAPTGDCGEVDPDVAARLACAAGRPLLVLLDAPEEMPPHLAQTLRQWTARTASWLRATGSRLAIACRPEYWEQAAALFPEDMLYALAGANGSVRVAELPPRQATRALAAYGLPDGALAPGDAGHPLAMRMLAQVRAAQGALCGRGAPTSGGRGGQGADPADEVRDDPVEEVTEAAPARHEIFSAFLDLLCLRVAQRLMSRDGASCGEGVSNDEREAHFGEPQRAAGTRADGAPADLGSVRRLAACIAGRLHEAARRCLGSGQGELSAAAFAELFPGRGGWAAAVLAEGALAPAGEGYRFVDEEFSDWLQGCHLDLDVALDALVPCRVRDGAHAVPVPRHRAGPVVQALLLSDRRDGAEALTPRLRRLVDVLGEALADGAPEGETEWWAVHLLRGTLSRIPDAGPYAPVLGGLAAQVARRPESAMLRDSFGPRFWRGLALDVAAKVELLRHLLPADDPADRPCERGRCLDVLEELLRAEPRTVQPLLCGWFSDVRPLRRRTDADGRTVPTVATAAQALLHTHRRLAVDELADALLDAAHPLADELLAELVRDELSAMCRAVERWANESRTGARAAAAARYGVRAARRVRTDADRALLRSAALALLHRPAARADAADNSEAVHSETGCPVTGSPPADCPETGCPGDDCGGVHRFGSDRRARDRLDTAALAILVRDPHSRSRHLRAALSRFAETGDAELAAALGTALGTHPEPVFAAYQSLLAGPADPAAQSQAVRALARVRIPALARRAAALVREHAVLRPWRARADVAAFVACRLRHGPGARAVLRPLVAELLQEREPVLRAGIARVLGAGEGPLRDELLDLLLAHETDVSVLEALLEAVLEAVLEVVARRTTVVPRSRSGASEGTLVRRIGARMAATGQGAAAFDRALARFARQLPGSAGAVSGWVAEEPEAWTAVLGPRARRVCDMQDEHV